MKIKKVLMCAAILTACAGGIYLVTLWNSMSVDFDQFEEDEADEPSVSELSFDEQKEQRGMLVCCYENTDCIEKTEETKVSDSYWADSLIFVDETGVGCGVLMSQDTPVTSSAFPGTYTVYSEALGLESTFTIPAAGTYQKLVWDYKAGTFEVLPSTEEEARKYFRKDD